VDVGKRFGENLARKRKEAEISQEELAAQVSIHRTQIGLFETGKRLPRLDVLVALADALETSLDSFREGISWTPTITKPGEFHVSEPKS
jgi:transcriptional regulator with XRE-family HTH domain